MPEDTIVRSDTRPPTEIDLDLTDGSAKTTVLAAEAVGFYYGDKRVLRDVTLDIERNSITALIGPSGCGKTTFLRCLNRLNDLVPGSRLEGHIRYEGQDIYSPSIRPINLRRKIGMVFQRPNPFPKSIYQNIAFAPHRLGVKRSELEDLVESSLRAAALWDEVKDKLKASAFALSGGQQQRLCIARAIAVQPEVILMDEPCSALDPLATLKVEELMLTLKDNYTIVVVTHNMQQAARVSDTTAFFSSDDGGVLIETGPTAQMFTNPNDQRTEDYITGRFG